MIYDAIIIGAGPSGSATALLLSRAGKNVLLLEKKRFPGEKACGGGLTPSSVEKLGLLQIGFEEYEHKKRLDAAVILTEKKEITLRLADLELNPPFGYTVKREEFDRWLLQKAISEGAEYRNESSAKSFSYVRNKRIYEVVVDDGVYYRGKNLVVADGGKSLISQELFGGISHKNRYRVTGFAARRYVTVKDFNHTSAFVFISNKSIYPALGWAFPLGKNRVNIGAGILSQHLKKGMRISNVVDKLESFLLASGIISDIISRSKTASAPIFAGGSIVDINQIPEGAYPVGEAAGLVNPLTGEGINFALESAFLCSNALLSGEGLPGYIDKLKPILSYLSTASRITRLISASYFLTHALIGRMDSTGFAGRKIARFWIGA